MRHARGCLMDGVQLAISTALELVAYLSSCVRDKKKDISDEKTGSNNRY